MLNSWQSRLLYGVLIWLLLDLHAVATASLPNTPEAMLLFHGSAALLDLFLLYGAAWLCAGQLLDDMETLCLVSIIANGAGWALYLAYAPPVFYNTFMWGLSYVQWGRLLLDDDAINALRGFMVRRPDSGRAMAH